MCLTESDPAHWCAETSKIQAFLKIPGGMEVVKPGSLNPGVMRNSRRKTRNCLWTSHLPDALTKMTGGTSREPLWKQNNVKIVWIKEIWIEEQGMDPETWRLHSEHPFPHLLEILGIEASSLSLHDSVSLSKMEERSQLSLAVVRKIKYFQREDKHSLFNRGLQNLIIYHLHLGWYKTLGWIKSRIDIQLCVWIKGGWEYGGGKI